ncbi:MAG: tRNA (cytidine(34)-2'-O)-methyltransferase [Chromatiales bacterium]|nr:tRNA (cytidine(34)-2'-O)-methyltransferase [Chromatiales bacterium]
MFHVILYQPEIPPNTGNIMRLCANTGSQLHLVRPLGFDLDDSKLRRAGLDYREWASVAVHDDLAACLAAIGPTRVFACSTRGTAVYTQPAYRPGDAFLFGPETRGLPDELLDHGPEAPAIRIPMVPGNRSLNLSNAAAVIVFEAWRQQGFAGA